jgi:hypothetical protein
MGITQEVRYFAHESGGNGTIRRDIPLGHTHKEADYHGKALGYKKCPECHEWVDTVKPCCVCQGRIRTVEFFQAEGLSLKYLPWVKGSSI